MPLPQPVTPNPPATGFDPAHAHDALRELIDHGVELVRTLVQQARAEPVPHPFWGDKAPVEHPTEHIARCYDRITRSVRRTIALAKHLDDPARPTNPPRPSVEPIAPRPANDTTTDSERPDTPERPDQPDWHPDWIEDFSQDHTRLLADIVDDIQADLSQNPIPRTQPTRPKPRQSLYAWSTLQPADPDPKPPDPPPSG